jgi:hypothetical protein
MRQAFALPRARRAAGFTVVVVATFALLAVAGCTSVNSVNTETKNVVDSTGTVQASMSAEPTGSDSVLSTAPAPAPGSPGAVAPSTKPGVATVWPTKVGTFAKNFKGPVWYPKYMTAGYKLDSLDVVEFDPGSGLVADIVYLNGEKTIGFTQGSPATRDYEIVSVGKVAWGTEQADIVYEDPEDTTSPQMIVYSKGGNFAELYGDAGIGELTKVAASMVPVK